MSAKEKRGPVKEVFPRLELVSLSIPRRVYTLSHLHYMADPLADIYRTREKTCGLKIVEQAPYLWHLTVRMEEV